MARSFDRSVTRDKSESLSGLGQIAACLIHHVADNHAVKLLESTPIEIAFAMTRVAAK